MTRIPLNAKASQLLNEAQVRAVEALTASLGYAPPRTPRSFELLAQQTHRLILAQALAGEWSELGVTEPAQFAGLAIRVENGNEFRGEPPVVFRYDFSKTALPTLQVRMKNRRNAS